MPETRVYDKAKWHFEGEQYPPGLAESNAYTHGGFLLAWLLKQNLLSPSFLKDHARAIADFKSGKISSRQLNERVDGVLDSDMLTDTGNAFAEDYIDESYLEDYEMLFEDNFADIYDVPDNETTFEMADEMLDTVYAEWQAENDG